MNKLGELKTKIDTKINAVSNVTTVSESIEYNPDDEEWFDIGDQVSFKWNLEGNPDATILGTVKEIETIGGNRYYNIASYNKEKNRVENFFRVCPVSNEMKKIYEEAIDETCSGGCCGAGAVSGFAKRLGKAPKKKNKKRLPESFDTKLFKESILNDMPCESLLEGHKFKYFMNEGKWYLSCNNALVKTFDKDVMIESVDEIINGEEPSCGLLEGYSCYEMNILMEEITASTTAGSDMNDEQLQAAIIASAQKNSNNNLNPQQENELKNNADNEQIKKQNIDAAKKLELNVGQTVTTTNPQTSQQEDSELAGVDKTKGLSFLKKTNGDIDIEPAT